MKSYTVVYDGDCRVCSRFTRMLASWDSRGSFEIVPFQESGVPARFPWIPEGAYAESLQLIRNADGRTWEGAAAVEQLLRVLPHGRGMSWVFRIPFVRVVADRLYRWFARHRHDFGCGEHCRPRPGDATRS